MTKDYEIIVKFAFKKQMSIIQRVMRRENKSKTVSPYLLVILSFLGVILLGSFLLSLPFAHKNGQWGLYLDSLFHAFSATCVTGLSTYINGIGEELTLFGQIVILVMIQIGGLGFITILTFFVSLIQRKLQFKDRVVLAQAVNSNSIADVGKFVRRVIAIVAVMEIAGFLLGLPAFLNVPEYSTWDAIWASLFTSISAFNNAGFDIFGATSLIRGAGNSIIDGMPLWAWYYMQTYIMLLIVIGGLSFITIIETVVLRRKVRQWSAFTRISLIMTPALLIFGFAMFCLTDVINGNIDAFQALFQSVTTRTAGFANFDQSGLSPAGKTTSVFLMFVGGSPIGTAGGIKTTTLFIIILCLIRFFQGKRITAFKREFTKSSIIKAMTLLFLSIANLIVAYGFLASFEKDNALATHDNLIFEAFSAFGTVGLSAGLTPHLSVGSKIVLCILMFFGRLGPITLFQIFQKKTDNEEITHYQNVQTDVIIG